MINILHIIPDDKFIDFVIDDFSRFKDISNKYVLLNDSEIEKFTYIKNVNAIEVIIMNSAIYNQIIADTTIDIVVFHSMGIEWSKQFLRDLNVNPIIYWISWGWDYVSQLKLNEFKPKTRELFNAIYGLAEATSRKNTILKNSITRYFKKRIKNFLHFPNRRRERELIKSLYRKVDFCSCVVPNEFSFFIQIPGFRADFLHYKIGFVNNPFNESDEIKTLGNSIWLGNSYTLSNNHLDVIYQLKELNIKNEIIVPLSYGLNTTEHPELLHICQDVFGEKFTPITDYVSFEEYNKLLEKSSVAIFNHIRQQAVGNILMMLWQGSKVFLSEQSPVYQYLKKMDVLLFSVENELTVENINGLLTLEQIKRNRNIVFRLYSKEAIEQTNSVAIECLMNEVQKRKM